MEKLTAEGRMRRDLAMAIKQLEEYTPMQKQEQDGYIMKKPSGRGRVILVICLLVAAAGFLVYRYEQRKSMIACTMEWGRLASFPQSMRDFTITAEGSMFTRGFRSSFKADPATIEQWISRSPGLKETTPDKSKAGYRKYAIKPGGGAQHAEVTIDDTTHEVRIYVYWS